MQLCPRLRHVVADLALLLLLIAAGGAIGLSAARLGEWAAARL
jgi:hypothetical protein